MVYLIGVGHSVQVDRKGDFPETKKFKEYLESEIKELNIALIGEEFSKEALSFPYNDIPSTTTQDVAKKLNIEHRFCDLPPQQRENREKFWLECIKDRIGEKIIFVCGCKHLETFASLLTKNGVEVNILPIKFISEKDREFDRREKVSN